MTEEEWRTATDPAPMLDFLRHRATDRKLRLFTCAWAYDYWPRLPDESRDAVEVAERYADGLAGGDELLEAFRRAQGVWDATELRLGGRHGKSVKSQDGSRTARYAAQVARDAADPTLNTRTAHRRLWRLGWTKQYPLACHLRDIFGSPLRPPVLDPSWLTSTVTALAAGIYDDRAFDRLPLLADALMDADCTDEDILAHCRGDGPHARGCWVVDLILGCE